MSQSPAQDPGATQVAPDPGQDPAAPGTEPAAPADDQTPGGAPATGTDDKWVPDYRQQQAARRSGLSDEELASLEEALGPERAADFLDQRADQHDNLSRQARELAQASSSTRDNGKGRAASAGEQAAIPEGEFELSPKLLDETWEQSEPVARFFKPFVDEMNMMRQVLRDLGVRVQGVGDRTSAITADAFFAGLGDEHAEIFGKGPTNVHSTAPEQQARLKVIASADRIAEGFRSSGTPIHASEALERALSMEMGETLGTIARKRQQARLQKRGAQTQAGPRGRRQTKPQTREARKAAFVKEAPKVREGTKTNRP